MRRLALALGLALVGCGDPEGGAVDAEADAGPQDLTGPTDQGTPPDLGRLDQGTPDAGALPPEPDASTPPAPTIFDVQQGFVAPGAPVTLEGVVTAALPEGVFLSESPPRPFGGIFVVTASATSVDVGDQVRVSGVVEELALGDAGSRTQVRLTSPGDLRAVGTSTGVSPLPATLAELTLPELAEPFEGTLVELGPRTLTELSTSAPELRLDALLRVDARRAPLDPRWLHIGARFERVVGAVQVDARGLALVLRSPEDRPRSPPAADGCLPLGAHLLCLDRASWPDARVRCAARGGRLVIMETATENATVSARVAEHTGRTFWIAASDRETEGTFRWVDGSTLAYDAWGRGEPNDAGSGEDCAQGNFRNTGEWNDGRCGGGQTFVCEFEADAPRCEGDAECGEQGRCVDGRCRR